MATAFDLWEAQMSWISVRDFLWLAGALFTAGFVVYGVWLCIMGPEAEPHYARRDARPRGATPEAKPRALRRYEAARRGAHGTSRRMAIS